MTVSQTGRRAPTLSHRDPAPDTYVGRWRSVVGRATEGVTVATATSRATVPWRGLVEPVAIVVGLAVVYAAAPLTGRWWLIGTAIALVAAVATVPVSFRWMGRIATSDRPLQATARAAAVLGTLVVLTFATAYHLIDAHDPEQLTGLETRLDAAYFSMTLLTTVGTGDVAPTGQLARGVATAHMAFNLVVVAVVARGLVAAASTRRRDLEAG
jgi:voltage-gated potassium channel